MALLDLDRLISRQIPPEPWAEGDNIPWDDPAFSERILAEHLCEEHDRASRRPWLIEAHVRFIGERLVQQANARVLDLACGPGLYLHHLARLGHRGHGIDFSPAAIRHARSVAERQSLDCSFERADLRQADFGVGFDMALLVYGQINVFQRHEARDILRRAHAALAPGGTLVLEPQTPEAVCESEDDETDWTAVERGLFSDDPHLLLHERFWDEPTRTATDRWHVVDAATAAVERYAMSTCSYDDAELVDILRTVGFERIDTHLSLGGNAADATPGLFGLTVSRSR